MKKLVIATALFSAAAVSGTVFVWWDTAPEKTAGAKHRLDQVGSNLGPETRHPVQPGPAIHTFYCVGSEKDCGPLAPPPAVVHAVPEPGTLGLIGLGLALMLRRKKNPPPTPVEWR